jgi:hypothetical protein
MHQPHIPELFLDLTIYGIVDDFVARLPLRTPAGLDVGDEVMVLDDGVEPRRFRIAELLEDGEHARLVVVHRATARRQT